MTERSSFSGGPRSGFDIEGGREEQEQMLQGPGYLNARANAVQAVQKTIGNTLELLPVEWYVLQQ